MPLCRTVGGDRPVAAATDRILRYAVCGCPGAHFDGRGRSAGRVGVREHREAGRVQALRKRRQRLKVRRDLQQRLCRAVGRDDPSRSHIDEPCGRGEAAADDALEQTLILVGNRSEPGRRHAQPEAGRIGIDPDRHESGSTLLHQTPCVRGDAAGLQQRVRTAQRRMTCERKFGHRGEDPQPIVRGRVGGRLHEGGLGQVGPAGDPLHLVGVEIVGLEHDSDRIAEKRRVGEHVDLHEAACTHGNSIRSKRPPVRIRAGDALRVPPVCRAGRPDGSRFGDRSRSAGPRTRRPAMSMARSAHRAVPTR